MASKIIKDSLVIPDGEPPSEFLLIKMGRNPSKSNGDYLLDKESAKEVISTFKKRKLKLFFDYNHLSLDPKAPDDGIAAGWFDLDLREEGIWVTNIRWTEKAFNHIKAREFAYFSPVLKMNKNGYVIRLFNVAITNMPATDEIEPIIALSEIDLEESATKFLGICKGIKVIPDLETALVLQEIITQLSQINERMDNMDTEQVDVKEELMELDQLMNQVYILGGCLTQMLMESEDLMKEVYTKAQELVMQLNSVLTEKRKELDPEGLFEPMMIPCYSETQVKQLKELTGEDNLDRQLGKIMAFKETVAQYKELSAALSAKDAEIKALELKVEEVKVLSEKEKTVESFIKGPQPKLLAKQKAWAMSLSKDQLEAYLEDAPILKLSEKIVGSKVEAEVSTLELTKMDLEIIAKYNLNPEEFKREKSQRLGK